MLERERQVCVCVFLCDSVCMCVCELGNAGYHIIDLEASRECVRAWRGERKKRNE